MRRKKTMKKKKGGTPPKSKYKDLTYKSQVYRTKKTNSGERLYNPLTKRWIKNTASNRNSVLKQIEKSNVVGVGQGNYRLEQFSDEVLPNLFKSPSSNSLKRNSNKSDSATSSKSDVIPDTPVFEEGITVESCDLTMKTELIDLDDIQQSKDTITEENKNLFIRNKILYDIPGLITYQGIELPVIEYVSKGSYGKVYRYSSVTPLPEGWETEWTDQGIQYVNRIEEKELLDKATIEGHYSQDDDIWRTLKKNFTRIIRPRRPQDLYYSVIVKVFDDKGDSEIDKIDTINKKLGRGFCNTVNARIIELNNNLRNVGQTVAIMDSMDNSLEGLPKLKDQNEIIAIIEYLAKIFECLLRLGYTYTDIKAANILYKCYKNNKIKISLGDLGGLCKKGRMESCTFPPPEHMFHFKSNNCTEKTMVWGLGIVTLQLLKINVRDFYWDKVEELQRLSNYILFINESVPLLLDNYGFDKMVIKEIVNEDLNINQKYTLYNLIESMLEPDPEKRIKLIKIIEILN